MRRYDVDAIRVVALSLLILYHVTIGFQPWGIYFGFITNDKSMVWLFKLMEVFNIWRIPILFVVSGMGVYFSARKRNWTELFKDRSIRVLLPLIFGSLFVVPLYMYLGAKYYNQEYLYNANPGHLWFLGNIFVYVLILLPVFIYFKNRRPSAIPRLMQRLLQVPFGVLLIFAIPMVLEAVLINPDVYAAFAFESNHGFLVGLICFFIGYIFASSGTFFWNAVRRASAKMVFLAISLYLIRYFEVLPGQWVSVSNALTAVEATSWILGAFGFRSMFLNKRSRILTYCTSAVYPVYVVHLPVQMYFSRYIFLLEVAAPLKLAMLLISTFAGSLFTFEILKRIKGIRLLFGIRRQT